jgi:hypothetical protein
VDLCTPMGGRHHLGTVAGFKSEWWPVSNRNPGRHHVGIPGRNVSESALPHPTHPLCTLRVRRHRRLTQPQWVSFALFAGFIATMARSDFSRPCIIGFGSSPSRCGPSRSRNI